MEESAYMVCPCGFSVTHMIPRATIPPITLAVILGDTDALKMMILNGVAVPKDVRVCSYGTTTLLHLAPTVAMVRELISLGLSARVVDTAGRTPLHHAVECNRHIDLIQELVDDIVEVHKLSADQLEALNYELNRFLPRHEVIDLLLDYGAIFELTALSASLYNGTVKTSFSDQFIQTFLLRHFKEGKSLSLSLHARRRYYYPGIVEYIQICEKEIICMRAVHVTGKFSLFDVLASQTIIPLRKREGTKILSLLEKENTYSEYKTMIRERITSGMERYELLVSLRHTNVFPAAHSTDPSGETRIVQLNIDTVYDIAKFLENPDLRSFCQALNCTD